ncbi:hypothetical protein FKP32DRAFT_124828 [Trametes sanguinea]|nr:hypothetical protein FKP32DRAFT_124828 [Trametes sanguinea]
MLLMTTRLGRSDSSRWKTATRCRTHGQRQHHALQIDWSPGNANLRMSGFSLVHLIAGAVLLQPVVRYVRILRVGSCQSSQR